MNLADVPAHAGAGASDRVVAVRALRQAATLILMREGADGPEVLLLRRVERGDDRSSGAWVFPGGTLDAQDRHLQALCAGLGDADASHRLGLPAHGLDLYVTAVRECFEETGLLLARRADGDSVDAHAAHALCERGAGLEAACLALDARLAVDRLVYCAHWITPVGLPKRFDTRFFIARAPQAQTIRLAPDELSAHVWITPAAALAEAARLHIVPVTRRLLSSIAGFAGVAACLDHFTGLTHIPPLLPWRALGAAGGRSVMPWEPAYDELTLLDADGRGDAWCELRPFEATRLLADLWRVPGPRGNAYVFRLASGDAVAVDGDPDSPAQLDALKACAGGAIRWSVTTSPEPADRERAARAAARLGARPLTPDVAARWLPALDLGDGRRGFASPDGQVVFWGRLPVDAADGRPAAAVVSRALRAVGVAPRWLAGTQGFLVACEPPTP